MKTELTESTQTNSLYVALAVYFWLYMGNFETPSLNLDSSDQSNQNHSWLQTIVQLTADSFFFSPADTPDLLWEFLKKPCLALKCCDVAADPILATNPLAASCAAVSAYLTGASGKEGLGKKTKKELIALSKLLYVLLCKILTAN